MALRLPDLQDPLTGSHPVGPCKRSAAGQDIRHGIFDFAGWRLRLLPAYSPKSPLALGLLKLAGAGGLNIAETFPEGAGAARMDAG
ncbi:hypothetical protein LNQ03_03530 [Klebsiella pneumoniae subsp. pneumoniae]|nr:hypothetical protein [Klebsiella pneumoniae subsp. pneumoniae]